MDKDNDRWEDGYSLQYNWHRGEKADLIHAGGEKLRGKGRKTPRYFPHTIPA